MMDDDAQVIDAKEWMRQRGRYAELEGWQSAQLRRYFADLRSQGRLDLLRRAFSDDPPKDE